MKYCVLAFSLLVMLLSSCSTDFDIAADYEEVMLVYGLLDAREPVQYIRVQKGYLDRERSALDFSSNPDSIFYPVEQISVQLIRIVDNRTVTLTPSKIARGDEGDFDVDSTVVYTTTEPIGENETYRLEVTNLVTGKKVSAETNIVKSFRTVRPSDDESSDFSINLVQKDVGGTFRPVEISWSAAVNADVYDLTIRFWYEQWPIGNPADVDTLYSDWQVFKGFAAADAVDGQTLRENLSATGFFASLNAGIAKDPNVQRRPLAKPLEFRFLAGGEALYNFIKVSQAQLGITQLQAQTVYTNINGGLGVFSSRTGKERRFVMLASPTLDSLACGSLTGELNFKIPDTSCFQ